MSELSNFISNIEIKDVKSLVASSLRNLGICKLITYKSFDKFKSFQSIKDELIKEANSLNSKFESEILENSEKIEYYKNLDKEFLRKEIIEEQIASYTDDLIEYNERLETFNNLKKIQPFLKKLKTSNKFEDVVKEIRSQIINPIDCEEFKDLVEPPTEPILNFSDEDVELYRQRKLEGKVNSNLYCLQRLSSIKTDLENSLIFLDELENEINLIFSENI